MNGRPLRPRSADHDVWRLRKVVAGIAAVRSSGRIHREERRVYWPLFKLYSRKLEISEFSNIAVRLLCLGGTQSRIITVEVWAWRKEESRWVALGS